MVFIIYETLTPFLGQRVKLIVRLNYLNVPWSLARCEGRDIVNNVH